MATGQSSFQVRALMEHVDVKGQVLDICGATGDAVQTVLTKQGLRVHERPESMFAGGHILRCILRGVLPGLHGQITLRGLDS